MRAARARPRPREGTAISGVRNSIGASKGSGAYVPRQDIATGGSWDTQVQVYPVGAGRLGKREDPSVPRRGPRGSKYQDEKGAQSR